jgi:leucine dehydrogenase
METDYVTGLPESMGGGGDPSPVTAYGTYIGMKAMAKKVFGSENLSGKRIIVQGAGQVGSYLVDHLMKEKAIVFVSDIFGEKAKALAVKHKVEVIEPDKIFDLDVDIYAPCALGASLNGQTIPKLKCAIVAGAANNQLEDEIKHGYMLMDRNIIYAPDFLINAGGLINVYLEYLGGYSKERAHKMAENIYDTLLQVLHLSDENKISPQEAAMDLANKRIASIGNIKLTR